jgi:hypothetical protein
VGPTHQRMEVERSRRVFWAIRKMRIHIRSNSGPGHPKDVEIGKYQEEEEL